MSLSCPLCPVPCAGLAPGRGWWDPVCESTSCFHLPGKHVALRPVSWQEVGRCLAASSPNCHGEPVGWQLNGTWGTHPPLLRGQASWHVQAACQGGQLGSESRTLAGSGLQAGAHLRKGTGLLPSCGTAGGPKCTEGAVVGQVLPTHSAHWSYKFMLFY